MEKETRIFKKLSIDLTCQNYERLSAFKNETGLSIGMQLNALVDCFYGLSGEQMVKIADMLTADSTFSGEVKKILYTALDENITYERSSVSILDEQEQLMRFAKLFLSHVSDTECEAEKVYQRIRKREQEIAAARILLLSKEVRREIQLENDSNPSQ